MSSELSPHPTPETHPDILKMCTVSATNNSILEAGSKRFFIFTPRNFSIVREIKDHLDPIEVQASRKTVGQVVKENAFELFYYLVIGGLEIGGYHLAQLHHTTSSNGNCTNSATNVRVY